MCKAIVRFVSTMSFLLVFAGCSHNSYKPVSTSDYNVFRKNHDLSIGWKISSGERFTVVEGYVLNNCCFIMQDLELWITLLDSAGSEKERKSYFVIPTSLPLDGTASFQVEFTKNLLKRDDRIRFLYRYRVVEGNDELATWMNSFEEAL